MIYFHIKKLAVAMMAAFFFSAVLPALAIQNIGFPDDQPLRVDDQSDLKSFQLAQKTLQDALSKLIAVGDIKGESRRLAGELKSIAINAEMIERIALRSGDKAVATFMSSIKGWSTSGDADDIAPELIRKISDHIVNMKGTVK